jgi:diamine N-acetyltransferase
VITFKPFAQEDIGTILALMKEFNAIDDYPFNENERRENLMTLLSNESFGKLWLILHEERIAGYTFLGFGFSFEFKGRDAFIDELFIRPEFQGKGIGKAAIDFVIEQSKALGVKVVHLEAEKHNERALQLYQKRGFKDHNRYLLSKYL